MNDKKSTFRAAFLILMVCTLLGGCAPRGETRSLGELLQNAKNRYSISLSSGNSIAVVSEELKGLVVAVTKLETGNVGQRSSSANEAARRMMKLLPHAGYTARPAFAELATQFKTLSDRGSGSAATSKLLAMRTYNLLSRELETTRFQL